MDVSPVVTVGHSAAIDELLSPDGWVYASSPPVEEGDPGRFHALFGRDSLIFALQVLRVRPAVAAATLRALARLQGVDEDPETEEQPGRILHEYRLVAPAWLIEAGWPVRDGGIRYYGSSDSTSWFLVLLDATGDAALQAELGAAREAAAAWLCRALDEGGGLVRSGPRRFPGGLRQQGWRDAADGSDEHGGGIVTEDKVVPPAPLADADSQAAAIAALDALARLDPNQAKRWTALSGDLREQVRTWFTADVMAIDGEDRPVSGAGSQLGWLLWAGALDEHDTRRAVQRLTSTDVLTAYGVRTLANTHPAFLADGYHRGAVWPFDCWLAWGGLLRAGASTAAEQVRTGVRDALARLGRYPELYAVSGDTPVLVPFANRFQAWTLGAAVAFDAGWTGHPDADPPS